MALGTVSFTLGGADRVTFAVYSADDGSLDFYKRMDVPEVGDTFEGKTVTAVYTGFETANYHLLGYDPTTNNWNSCDTNTPWFNIRNNVTSINVVDQGIKPYNLKFFFRRFENLESANLVNFDLSETVSINSMFLLCKSLKTAKIPGISRQCTEFKDAFACCPALTDLEFGNSDFSGGKSFYHMFNCDSSLSYDCTDWNVPPDAEHHGFNSIAAGVILPKPWQPTAFAVFSLDDGSLNFYKREFKDMPKVGEMFDGKTVTEVYTGFENTHFSIQTSDDKMAHDWTCNALPWWNRRDSVKTATVVDTGITPTSICGWFMRMPNLTTADLSNLDCVNTYTAWCAFLRCTSLTSLKSPKNFNPIDLSDFVYNCDNLKDLDTSTWNMGRCQNIGWAFSGCRSLETLPGAESWNTSSLNYTNGAFAYCNLLKLDCSDWKVQVNADHKEFNHESPGVILPKPWQPTAFAVFSADDGSLDFYKREFKDMPKVGDTFEGKTVTEVYTGFEDASYVASDYDPKLDNWETMTPNTPWFGVRGNVSSVKIADSGISPRSLRLYFYGFENLKTADLSLLDTSKLTSLYATFCCDNSIESIKLPGFFSTLTDCEGTFASCSALTALEIEPSDFSGVNTFFHMFMDAKKLWFDCSSWNVNEPARHNGMNQGAHGVTLPKAWQAGAFAIYSADDGSLDFYKRVNCELPSTGSTFNGKAVTSVYTGFETQRFVDTSSNHSDWTSQQPDTPWWGRRLEISSANVVDAGIRPSSVDYWFYGMENLKAIAVANLDTSSCDDFKMTFGHCGQIETIDLSAWSTASLCNLNGTFLCCLSLSTLDIDGWDTSKVVSFHCLMFDCKKMNSIKMQKVVDNLSVTECANDFRYLFNGCEKLTTINLSSWNISNVTDYMFMFFACHNLTLDCSHWNVQQDAWHGSFNSYAPGVILPKVWQPIAFAVFSADDKSLDFYKREYKDMPKIGDTFNNKTVSEVYSDIENYDFKISYETSPTGVGNAPWWNHRADIFSVKVVDVIKPKNMCGWFFYFANVTSIDLGPIDTSEVTSLFGTFDRCFSLKTLNVSMMNTSKVTSMDCAFFCDGELTKLDLSGWDFSKVVNISRMFYDCKKLGTLSMPSSPNFVSHITSFIYMFNGCTNLVFDCSNWDVQISADHTKFNYGAPGVILPKKWQ